MSKQAKEKRKNASRGYTGKISIILAAIGFCTIWAAWAKYSQPPAPYGPSDWKTYTNHEAGFEFAYPYDFELKASHYTSDQGIVVIALTKEDRKLKKFVAQSSGLPTFDDANQKDFQRITIKIDVLKPPSYADSSVESGLVKKMRDIQ